MEKQSVRRGQIYLHDFGNHPGSVQNGVRPVLVVQGDEFNRTSPTTVVAAITTSIKKRYLPSHIFLNDRFGLREPSMVMLEQLQTVNQRELTRYIGCVEGEWIMRSINIGFKQAMGLWIKRPEVEKQEVKCLCSRCLRDYMDSGLYVIRRQDLFATEKDRCEKCGNFGWDYIIRERRSGTDGNRKKAAEPLDQS